MGSVEACATGDVACANGDVACATGDAVTIEGGAMMRGVTALDWANVPCWMQPVQIVVGACVVKGVKRRRNLRFRSVTQPEPSTLITY